MSESQTAPIVLVHGILGFTKITFGKFKIGDYYREIPDALRKDGHSVPDPPQTNRVGSVAERAYLNPWILRTYSRCWNLIICQ